MKFWISSSLTFDLLRSFFFNTKMMILFLPFHTEIKSNDEIQLGSIKLAGPWCLKLLTSNIKVFENGFPKTRILLSRFLARIKKRNWSFFFKYIGTIFILIIGFVYWESWFIMKSKSDFVSATLFHLVQEDVILSLAQNLQTKKIQQNCYKNTQEFL